jgi:NAD-dependent oxidoreductase involved in siderophore biosynthesis
LIHVIAADRALYGVLDLIQQSFGSLSKLSLHEVHSTGDFIVIEGTFGCSSLSLWLQSARDMNHRIPDGSARYCVDMVVASVFGTGTLSLLSLAGPVIWNANLFQSTDSAMPVWDRVNEPAETRASFYEQRIRANVVAFDRLRRQFETGRTVPNQSPEVLLEISRVWNDISSKIT